MMSNTNADNIGYGGSFEAYRNAGWVGVLPLAPMTKWPAFSIPCAKHAPKSSSSCEDCISYTGYTGIDPSYADMVTWAESERYRGGNLSLRMPNNSEIAVVGIDVDNYGAKTGGVAFAEAIRRWGPLPPAPRSTSREGNVVSGIRLFRVPPGTKLRTKITFDDLGIGDIEICQWHHRYVVCWPSIHPEGREYWWRNEADQLIGIPSPTDLPWLPQPWVDALRIEHTSNLDNTPIDVRTALTRGEPSIKVHERTRQAIRELNLPGQSRHDTTLRHVLALMRLGKSGEPGVGPALKLLCDVFVAARQVDHSDTPEGARLEFQRMVSNDNAARELANPGFTDWFDLIDVENSQISPDIQQIPGETGPKPPEMNGAPSGEGASELTNEISGGDPILSAQPTPLLPASTAIRADFEHIENGFWDSRESLHMIYTTALARMCPPWAVLAHTAARGLTMVRPHVTLPPLIGGRGSLNWFAAVVAPSGGGKGASSACARLLIPGDIPTRNVGSGEGIIAAFGRPGDDDDPAPTFEALMFTADEVDTLSAMNQRSASTTLSILRSGFSGETLGFSYAAKDKRRHIGAHTYRMTFVVSVQPTRAGWLIDDGGGGTPQRFMWFPGTDSRIRKDRPWESGPLTLPAALEWQYPREIVVPDEAADLILDERVKAMQGDQTALDGHALYCREKFAYALAVLDGRVEMTSEDWELSGVAANMSTYTRELMIDQVREAANTEAVERGLLRGVEQHAADTEKAHQQLQRVQRIVRWLVAKVESAGESGTTLGALKREANSRDRDAVESALQGAAGLGLIGFRADTETWVKL